MPIGYNNHCKISNYHIGVDILCYELGLRDREYLITYTTILALPLTYYRQKFAPHNYHKKYLK